MGSFIFIILFSLIAQAAEPVPFGQVKFLAGFATGGGNKSLKVGDFVYAGESIHTLKKSIIKISLNDRSGAFQLGPETEVVLEKRDQELSVIDLTAGAILSTIKKIKQAGPSIRYKVKAQSVAMGVRGTTFFAKLRKDGRVFQCLCEGTVETTWNESKELKTSKHHDVHQLIDPKTSMPAPEPMGTEHSDADIAELKKII